MITLIKKITLMLLLAALICTPGFAETVEASSYWQEFDITFWQTFPFATIFGYIVDRQLAVLTFPGQAVHWGAVFPFAAAISAANAFLHTRRRIENERTGSGHQDHIR
jgi:hypothetical protein